MWVGGSLSPLGRGPMPGSGTGLQSLRKTHRSWPLIGLGTAIVGPCPFGPSWTADRRLAAQGHARAESGLT